MRKSIIGTTLITFLICLIACKKDNTSPQSLIRGKWNMQSIHSVEYLGNVKQIDTLASVLSFSNQVQFNNDGSYINIYINSPIQDTITGNYKVSGNTLSFSNFHSNYVFLPTPFPLFLPAGVNVSISNQITQINSTDLVIHSESNLFDSATNINTKIITDQYYIR